MKKKLLIGLAAALGIALAALVWRLDIPHWQKLDLSRITDMPGTTTVFAANGEAVGALHGGENRFWVPLEDIPENVQNAFIAAEDLRFYRHRGVDLYRLLGALWHDVRTFSYAQGASTITQQLIKLTHLTQTKTLSRKAQEIVLALKLEKAMDKRQILEAYLNAVYFGHGAYGVEAAARTYFGKASSELTLAEGALLAGVIKSPANYAPHLNPEKSIARRNGILETMWENGFITQAQKDAAQHEALRLAMDDGAARYAWYMDAVLDEAMAALGVDADEVISGGYRIHTGLDSRLQSEAEALFADADNFPESAPDGTPVQAALAALDTGTGELSALIGGRSYDVRRGLNRATGMRRQPGSAFKPVSAYAAAVDAYGYLPTSIVDDTPRTFAGGYTPGNAGGATYGKVTLREALSRSLNIATVALAEEIGPPALRTYAQRFGLELSPKDANLSLALGSLTDGVSPADLGAAYCALANGGGQVKAHAIRFIEDNEGHVVYEAPSDENRAVSEETAYMITDMLKTAATSGSAKALAACGLPVAGKTGTVADGESGTRDLWTVAYTPQTAVSVWMGYDAPDDDHRLPASLGGSGYPARLCAAFLEAANLPGTDFQRPDGVRTVLIDALALADDRQVRLSTEKTPAEYIARELFRAGELPEAYSENWSAPRGVEDFRLLTSPGEMPVLAFTVQEASAEYVVTRMSGGSTVQLAVLKGTPGEEVRFCDDTQDLSQLAGYTLIPRNGLLYAADELVTGPIAGPVQYAPGGLLNTIMGVGAAEATPTPAEIEPESDQSLFT